MHLQVKAKLYLVVQFKWYKHDVNEKSIKVGRLQCIKAFDGYLIPIDFKSGLPYMPISPYTDHEWETLPRLILTSDKELNASFVGK